MTDKLFNLQSIYQKFMYLLFTIHRCWIDWLEENGSNEFIAIYIYIYILYIYIYLIYIYILYIYIYSIQHATFLVKAFDNDFL